jgi:hypothetical protein
MLVNAQYSNAIQASAELALAELAGVILFGNALLEHARYSATQL